jgi:hypothetical protein
VHNASGWSIRFHFVALAGQLRRADCALWRSMASKLPAPLRFAALSDHGAPWHGSCGNAIAIAGRSIIYALATTASNDGQHGRIGDERETSPCMK